MANIVENLLFVATGIPHPSTRLHSAQLIWEIVVRELKALPISLPSEQQSVDCDDQRPKVYSLVPIVQLLAQKESSLHRFARRMILMDNVQEHASEEILDGTMGGVPEAKTTGVRGSAVREALVELGWSSDVIAECLERPDGPVKTARMTRADRATQAMDGKTYKEFCSSRTSSFTTEVQQCLKKKRKLGEKSSEPQWLSALSLDTAGMTPLLREVLAYLAAEIVFLIADFVLILRADSRSGSFLRFVLLNGNSSFDDVWSCLATDQFGCEITADEVRNVARLFSSNFLIDSRKQSSLLIIL
jgi:hypothetical protein